LSNIITGTGSVIQNGSGRLDLAGGNSYSGGTMIESGKLEIASGASAGTGAITFEGTGILKIDATPNLTFANTVAGLTASDTLDLAGMIAATTTATTGVGSYNSGTNLTTLTVHDTSGGGTTDTFYLSGNYSSASWIVTSDGAGGVNVVDPALTDPLSVPDAGTASIGAAAATAITFAGASGTLQLGASQSFTGTVAGFGGNDQIDLGDIGFGANATLGYAANSSNTGGVLSISDGTHTANITLLGQYTASSFAMASDGNGGTLITDAPMAAAIVAGTSLDIAAASNETVTFAGGTGSLVLADPGAFSGQIAGFTGTAPDAAHSDVIDLAGVNFDSSHFADSYNAATGVLTVGDGTDSASLTFDNFNGNLSFASDGNGGTDIFDPPATGSHGSSPAATVSNVSHDTNFDTNFGMNLGNDQFRLSENHWANGGASGQSGSEASGQGGVSIGGTGNDNFVFHGNGNGNIQNAPQAPSSPVEVAHTSNEAANQQLASLINHETPAEPLFDPTHDHGGALAAQFHQVVASATHLH
jgi:autotransporter-associated beta strand protein